MIRRPPRSTPFPTRRSSDLSHPVIPPALIADIAGGSYPAVINILLALRQRDRTGRGRSEEHTSELQSQFHLVCRLLLEKKKKKTNILKTYTQKLIVISILTQ